MKFKVVFFFSTVRIKSIYDDERSIIWSSISSYITVCILFDVECGQHVV